MLSAEIPLHTSSWTNARGFPANGQNSRRKKSERMGALAIWMTLRKPRRELFAEGNDLTIRFTRVAPGTLDDDNLPSSMKYVRDELVRLMGYGDDSHRSRITFEYAQEKRGAGVYAVRVELSFRQAFLLPPENDQDDDELGKS